MASRSVLIVGGGPAGSTCAWRLRQSGIEVTILDKARFPRNKVCGGWITPQVLEELRIRPGEYAQGRTFQPILGFRTGGMSGGGLITRFKLPVSYGIRRCEFDEYLLRRCGAPVMEGTPLNSLERSGDDWIANGRLRAGLIVGAGGHFCPVARFLGARLGDEPVVAAQEVEFLMSAEQRPLCAVQPEIPELYFCADMKGYGWCFRKGDYLNIGLGRLDRHLLTRHVEDFLLRLKSAGRIPPDVPAAWQGHAYLLYGVSSRKLAAEGILLIGDSAGLAYAQSGEGIRPAVESGLLAAEVILEAEGDYSPERLQHYGDRLERRFGRAGSDWTRKIARLVPERMVTAAARSLLAKRWFSRRVLVDRWFLHSHVPALSLREPAASEAAS
jgi:flavin-dependent dehydrogenase